jgi:hypothetical protein
MGPLVCIGLVFCFFKEFEGGCPIDLFSVDAETGGLRDAFMGLPLLVAPDVLRACSAGGLTPSIFNPPPFVPFLASFDIVPEFSWAVSFQ